MIPSITDLQQLELMSSWCDKTQKLEVGGNACINCCMINVKAMSEDCVEKRKSYVVVSPDSLQLVAHFITLNRTNGHTTRRVQTHTKLKTVTNLV